MVLSLSISSDTPIDAVYARAVPSARVAGVLTKSVRRRSAVCKAAGKGVQDMRACTKCGAYVAKVLAGGTDNDLLALLKQHFKTVKHAKPPASRKDSSEWYVIAQGFKGRAEG